MKHQLNSQLMSPLICLMLKILHHAYNILLCSVILFSWKMFSDKGFSVFNYKDYFILISVPQFTNNPIFLCPFPELWYHCSVLLKCNFSRGITGGIFENGSSPYFSINSLQGILLRHYITKIAFRFSSDCVSWDQMLFLPGGVYSMSL